MTEILVFGVGIYEIGQGNEYVRKHAQKEYYVSCL